MSGVPILFVAHGAPTLAIDHEKGAELAAWAARLPKPRAILAISPHWETRDPTIGATRTLPLLYDFQGFPKELYAIEFPYTPAPALADRVEELLSPDGRVTRNPDRRLDHGVWVPMLHMFSGVDVPLLQLSLARRTPEELFALGKRLAPLADEGTMIVTTGVLTHNLRSADFGGAVPTPSWARAFDAWCEDVLVRGDVDALIHYRMRAPHAAMAHPTEEHFLPLIIAAGAASVKPHRVSFPIQGFELSSLSRRCVQLDPA